MSNRQTLQELKTQNVDKIKNRPAISVFRDNMSLGGVLEKAYITPKYHLHKQNADRIGISEIYEEFKENNVIFVGRGGSGKTTSFLFLYTGISENTDNCANHQLYYFFAPDLYGNSKGLDNYQKKLKKILLEIIEPEKKSEKKKDIDYKTELNGILLLDGLEEAYGNNSKRADDVLKKLNNSGITFWVSCRSSFYEKLGNQVVPYFAERVELKCWESKEYNTFFDYCLKDNDNKELVKSRINKIGEQLESLMQLPLFATMILFIAESDDIDDVHNEYELIELFLNKWVERECKEKHTKIDKEKCYETMRNIALMVYLNTDERPNYSKSVKVFRDLLITNNREGSRIHGFVHREFLVYFIVNALIDAASNHPEKIIWWFSQTFYDDITNLMKPVLAILDHDTSNKMYQNLFSVYKNSYTDTKKTEKDLKKVGLLGDNALLKLRDEILYFIFRLPNINYNEFARYAYDNSTDTMLNLGIAYGMATKDPSNPYTIEFAKKLIPNTPEDTVNRGWAMYFFGDVADLENSGYTYQDDEGKPWDKIRNNRLNRLTNDNKKYHTRVLDIALLYCFYYSRGFKDCTSYRDFDIIRNTNISLQCYKSEQKEFMKEKKDQLVSEYKKHLIAEAIKKNPSLINNIKKENLVEMNSSDKKYSIEIDDDLAQKILEQIEHSEKVLNNIDAFWKDKGEVIVEKYKDQLTLPEHNTLNKKEFETRLKEIKVLIITANYVEGVTVTHKLLLSSDKEALDQYVIDNQMYQFATINSIPVVHIWATDTSSYTQYGSFSAINSALERCDPKYVIAVGVAFGIDPVNQSLGDVLIPSDLVFYDNFNKVTDGKIKLKSVEAYRIDTNMTTQVHQIDREIPPESVGSFKWYHAPILTGGTVLSDVVEKIKLIDAALNSGASVAGGEMEASGIYYACKRIKGNDIPFMIVKGICDWGAEKNSWKSVIQSSYDSDTIKDCVQAYACSNAFDATSYILSQLNME